MTSQLPGAGGIVLETRFMAAVIVCHPGLETSGLPKSRSERRCGGCNSNYVRSTDSIQAVRAGLGIAESADAGAEAEPVTVIR